MRIERFFFPVFVLFVIEGANAQKIDEVIDFGDTLFVQHLYIAALNEFHRAYFFSEIENKSEISQKIADCYLAIHDYRSAISYYDSATYYSNNDSAKVEYALQKILCTILGENYVSAIYKLNELQTGSNEHLLHKKNLSMGISLFGAAQYEEAFRFFYNSAEPDDSVKLSRLIVLHDDIENLYRPSPAVASLMSVLIPGAGQMYTGKFYDGINSVLVLYGLTYISIYARMIDFPLILPFLNRYYVGGIRNANNHARDKKREKQYRFCLELMKIFPESGTLCTSFEKYSQTGKTKVFLNDSVSSELALFSKLLFYYKTYFSSQDVDACVFTPSCSVFMVRAIEKHGMIKGLLEGFDRLLRCHAFIGTEDYPLDRITNKYIDDN